MEEFPNLNDIEFEFGDLDVLSKKDGETTGLADLQKVFLEEQIPNFGIKF